MSTPYHAAYWARALTCNGRSDAVESLTRSMAGARVDLNPHQVDAALFAVRSPLSKGVILADEVGLGKTIEAGLIIAQRWAERRRQILLVVPATLRKQWQQELSDKFALTATILDGARYNAEKKAGRANPFDRHGELVACSYQFAAARENDIRAVDWDLVVFDEAHRLRNVYRTDSHIAAALQEATNGRQKLLLTATPLHNNLLELYGLVSFVDPHVFGDLEAFREQFARTEFDRDRDRRLRERLAGVCTRTLRRQVLEYIRFTARHALTQDFSPGDDEQQLYDRVSAYLQRDSLIALPASQRALVSFIMWKLLASSSFAIAGTLRKLVKRLEFLLGDEDHDEDDAPDDDFEELDETEDEWGSRWEPPSPEDVLRSAIEDELAELRDCLALADSIQTNAKGRALIPALERAFTAAQAQGAERKAVIFTESRRTQEYLVGLLESNGYGGSVVRLNGQNGDPGSRATYESWVREHEGTDRISGARSADTRAAIVDAFRDRAAVLVATEAAAEGVNLQFCSLVVNYDLPWNPQRVEQRIGRCHRYGQKHDIVVLNFVNTRNAADKRVYELLHRKFKLFEGVFGASDEVLGALEAGVDLERRIARVYAECRTEAEIGAAFDALQLELEQQIAMRMETTRSAVLEHFDEEVHARLRVHRERALAALDERQKWLLNLARVELGNHATFDDSAPRFEYRGPLGPDGWYNLDWRDAEPRGDRFFRLDGELGARIIEIVLQRDVGPAGVLFDLAGHGARVESLAEFAGASGWLECGMLTIESLQQEDSVVLAGVADDGRVLDDELCRRLLGLRGSVQALNPGQQLDPRVLTQREAAIASRLADVERRDLRWYDDEVAKLERWADDLKLGLERELRELDRALAESRRASSGAATLAEKLAAQKRTRAIEADRNRKRRDLFAAQDEIERKRDEMIAGLERQLERKQTYAAAYSIRWQIG